MAEAAAKLLKAFSEEVFNENEIYLEPQSPIQCCYPGFTMVGPFGTTSASASATWSGLIVYIVYIYYII